MLQIYILHRDKDGEMRFTYDGDFAVRIRVRLQFIRRGSIPYILHDILNCGDKIGTR